MASRRQLLSATWRIGPKVKFYSNGPLEFGGGGEFTFARIARTLQKFGYSAEYIADRKYAGVTNLSHDTATSLLNGVPYRREPFISPPPPFFQPFYRRVPDPRRLSRDAVNLLPIDRLPTPWYLKLLRDRGILVIFLLHGFSFESMTQTHPLIAALQAVTRVNLGPFVREFNKGKFFLQVLTGFTWNRFVAAGANPERIFNIPSGIVVSKYPQPVPTQAFRVLYMGRLERVMKGTSLLFQIAQMLSRLRQEEVVLTIVGGGPDAERFRRFSPGQRVQYLGFLNESEKLAQIRSSDVLILTSNMDPYPSVVKEGLVCGLSVLSTPCSGPSFMLNLNPEFGKVLQKDSKVFVREILDQYEQWKSDPSSYYQLKQKRSESARKLFDSAEEMELYVEMVREASQELD